MTFDNTTLYTIGSGMVSFAAILDYGLAGGFWIGGFCLMAYAAISGLVRWSDNVNYK